jgi:glutamine synthetase
MLTLDALSAKVDAGEIDTVALAFADLYGRLHGKRFDAAFFLEEIASAGTHACNYLLTVDMEMDPVPGYKYANWELGYGDFHMAPDMPTLREAMWLDRTALVLCDVHDPASHEPVPVAPRSLLKRQVDALADLGFTAKAASELEYYIFQDSYRDAADRNYDGLTRAGWYLEDYHLMQGARTEGYNGAVRRHLSASGIPVENSKGEWGRGQHEMNIRYAKVLDMADRHAVMKLAMKEIADAQGISITFMAKPFADEAGSSCHIHLSLWQGDDSAFSSAQPASPSVHPEHAEGPSVTQTEPVLPAVHPEPAEGPARAETEPAEVSHPDSLGFTDTFRYFLGGWMAHVPELMACFAPTVNSYKRYQEASWAPVRIAWSHDNRTAGFRVVGEGPGLRIECRMPGADCNPYLAYSAALAAGIDGIRNKTEPPAPFQGDVYQAESLHRVPHTLREAARLFEASDFVREAFTPAVQEHYAHFFHTEADAYDNAVTDWERRRYFERI